MTEISCYIRMETLTKEILKHNVEPLLFGAKYFK